jgi:hypothetical protein
MRVEKTLSNAFTVVTKRFSSKIYRHTLYAGKLGFICTSDPYTCSVVQVIISCQGKRNKPEDKTTVTSQNRETNIRLKRQTLDTD